MPTNLNALIRYKTIDRCLQNKQRNHDIKMLIKACSKALAEFRGIYKGIGERTIRDDIRIMRSEILGFNAPIVFNNGYYTYSEPEYSIFNTTIGEKKLLTKILKILIDEWGNIDHPDIPEVVNKLSRITGFSLPSGINSKIHYQKVNQIEEDIAPTFEQRTLKAPQDEMIRYQLQDYTEEKDTFTEQAYSFKKPKQLPWFKRLFHKKIEMLSVPYSWQSIFNLLGTQSVKK